MTNRTINTKNHFGGTGEDRMTEKSLCSFVDLPSRVTSENGVSLEGICRTCWSFAPVLLMALMLVMRVGAQIDVNTTTPGNTSGNACSIQEAIYATEFGTNVALDQTDPDDTYYTGCSDPSGQWNTIVLHKTTYTFTKSWDGDAHNPFGPTATPIIFKTITIQGNGATLQRQSAENFRLFAIGQATIPYDKNPLTGVIGGSYSGTGDLTLQDVYVKGFQVKGGDGGRGAGGGLGAGGAIYVGKVSSGIPALTVENSTFQDNNAIGGNGTSSAQCCGIGGGGGGIGGNGGVAGGGARGNGSEIAGGGGGGTVFDGATPSGGYMCGGGGASFQLNGAQDGHDATCPGGGGGTVDNDNNLDRFQTIHGGDGAYGGGGAGAFIDPGDNGNGGNGGLGGGGGGALGGAIFSDNGNVVIQNSTFYNNAVTRGVGGGGSADNGGDSGGSVFSRDGSLTIENSTITGGSGTGAGAGVVFYADASGASFTLRNTIIANNGDQECIVEGHDSNEVLRNGSGNLITTNNNCPGVVVTSDPKLDSLKSNAPGDTPTMALLSDSPAIGAADASTSLATDQRGVTRKASPDIGAYELVPQADLSLTKSVVQSTYKAGDTVTYTLTVTNSGPYDANTVVVTDTYPSQLTYSSCTAPGGSCGQQGGSVVTNYSTLAANSSATITITGTLNSGLSRGTVVSNGASVSDSSPEDPVSTNNSATANFTVIVPDFSLSPVSPITIAVGGSGTSTLTVSSIDTFSSAVSLSATPPGGFKSTFSPNPVIPPSDGSKTSTLNVSLQPSVTAGSYTISETGTSGSLSHSASVSVNVQTTIAGVKNVINLDLGLGAIDVSGIATSLLSKLSAAQTTQTVGQIQTELNILNATLIEIQAQAGKHIKTSWTDGSGQAYNPDAVLATDVTALMSISGVNLVPNPIIGSIVNSTGSGIGNISVNVFNSKNVLVATATSDSTGFFYFPVTSVLTPGSTYTVKATSPKGYKSSTPGSVGFTWKSTPVNLSNIGLN
jgi:uncharacterized repeat protein (TIGR01451 family)